MAPAGNASPYYGWSRASARSTPSSRASTIASKCGHES
jgi:hypothetical protein